MPTRFCCSVSYRFAALSNYLVATPKLFVHFSTLVAIILTLLVDNVEG